MANIETWFDKANHDVLEIIFKHLTFKTIIEVCKISKHALEMVGERIVQHHHVNFTQLSDFLNCEGIFKHFGKKMSSFKLVQDQIQSPDNQSPFELFCRYIADFCMTSGRPSKLWRLKLRMDIPLMINTSPLRSIEQYFVNVQVLDVHAMGEIAKSDHDLLLEVIARNGQLRDLTLRDLDIIGDWFELLHRLDNLTLIDTSISSSELYTFLERKPELREFSYTNDDENTELIDAVCVNCPEIELLVDCHRFAPNRPYTHRYRELGNLRNVRRLLITTQTDEGHDIDATLALLCQRNTVEVLSISMTLNPMPDNQPFLAGIDSQGLLLVEGFTRLKVVYYEQYRSEQAPRMFRELVRLSETVECVMFRGDFGICLDDLTAYGMLNGKMKKIDVSGIECEHLVEALKLIGKTKERLQKYCDDEMAFSVIQFIVNDKQYSQLMGHTFHSLVRFKLD